MNGDMKVAIETRVTAKLKEEVSHERRHARQEVLTEMALERLDDLPCVGHAKQINLIRGGIVTLGFVASLGLVKWLVG